MKNKLFVHFTCYALIFAFVLILNYNAVADEAEIESPVELQNGVQGKDIKCPRSKFINSDFAFQPVEDGTKVIHDFFVKNIGNAVLLIKNVKTD